MATIDTLTVKVEADVAAFEAKIDKATKRVQLFDRQAGGASGGLTRLSGSTDRAGVSSAKTVANFRRLNETLLSMTSRMANVHPVAGKLVDVLGTFALGTGPMIAIIAGIAAAAAAFTFFTKEARGAKKAAEEAKESLQKWADLERTAGDKPHIDALSASYQALWKIQDALATARQDAASGNDKLAAKAHGDIVRLLAEEEKQLKIVTLAQHRLNQVRDERRRGQKSAAGTAGTAAATDAVVVSLKDEASALADLVSAGVATSDQIARLNTLMAGLADASLDASKGAKAQADALRELLSLLSAVNREADKAGGGRLSLLLPSAGTVLAPNQPTVEDITGPAKQVTAAFTPLSVAAQLLESAFGNLLSRMPSFMQQGMSNPLSIFSNAASMIIPAAIDAIFSRGASDYEARQQRERANRELANSATRASAALNELAATMRNVPLSFDPNYASYRVGMRAAGSTSVTRSGAGNVSIQTLNIVAHRWNDIKREMDVAAAAGDPLARALKKAG